jgi:uncharacterized membrane protein
MAVKIILLFTILVYAIIVSQPFMYILALKHLQLNLDVSSYIKFRKLIDESMRKNFKYVIYSALLSNLVLIIFTFNTHASLLFITSVIAFLALIADTLLTVKGNLPINDIINTWSLDSYPSDWTEYRRHWLSIFQYRQIASISGFVSFLLGTVFGS